jgi:succinate-semialdehyde dehydrogenase/glutarate-semialdehyde dehydrogenase
MKAARMGDPFDDQTEIGPQARSDLRDALHAQVEASLAKGARLLLGGVIPDRPGAWYPPTILAGVKPGQPAHDEEIFGPVAAVIRARDEADAIRIANDSEYGLGSGVLTGDRARGERIAAEELEAGLAFVNANVASNSRLPFGGVKHSGYGRECARYGLLEFCNIKTVVAADLPTVRRTAD